MNKLKIGVRSLVVGLSLVCLGAYIQADPVPTKPSKLTAPSKSEPSFEISDEELKALNLSESETIKFKELLDEMKNLTPAQKREIEEIGRAVEEKMRKQGLDPSNPDDMMKFLETEDLVQQPAPKTAPSKAPEPKFAEPKEPIKPVEVTTPLAHRTDTPTMLNQLIERLASLRQKVITRPKLLKALTSIQNEVSELSVYLNTLRAPDLIKLLSTAEFVRLHSSLEALHTNFIRYEPSISARKRSTVVNEDDPYEVLDIPYSATTQDIEQQFKKFADSSPEAVAQRLAKEGVGESMAKKIKKAAARTYTLVENSYKTLKNPESRKKIDAELRTVIESENRKERESQQAFDKLFGSLTAAVSSERILEQMNQLLEKYKPEEAKLLKAQIEREKQAFERSKKRIEVPQISASMQFPQEPFDPYGTRRDYGRKHGREYRDRYQQHERPGQGMPGQSAGKAPKGDKGAKSGAKDKDKAKDASKGKEADSGGDTDKAKKTKATPGELTDKDIDVLTNIKQAEKLLSKAKDKEGKIKVTVPVRNGEPMESEVDLPDILKRLEDELAKNLSDPFDVAAAKAAPAHLERYFAEHGYSDIEKTLKGIVQDPKKKLPEGAVAKAWKEKIEPYREDLIKDNQEIINHLDIIFSDGQRANMPKMKADKVTDYGLDLPKSDPWKKAKKKKKGEPEEPKPVLKGGVNLGALRDTAKNINTYLSTIKTK